MQSDEMRVVAEFAALSPSVHNTQPWRFVAKPHSLEILIEPGRALQYLDPRGRQMHISCGIVSEFARLAIRSLGSACTLRLLPDPDHPLLVAKLGVGGPEPIMPAEQRLVDAVGRRYTDRGPYLDDPISQDSLHAIRQAVGNRDCWLRVLSRPADRLSAIRLLTTAESIEEDDPEYLTELRSWVHPTAADDGLSQAAVEQWHDADRVSDVPLRDFSGRGVRRRPGAGDPPTVERDTLVLIGTDRDDPTSWLRAGRAIADALLTLTDAGLVSQPLGPVLDLPSTRCQLRRELGLVGYPQLLLRVGRGSRTPSTGRRPINDMFSVGVAS